MLKYAVIIRHLPISRPVCCGVVKCEDRSDPDYDVDEYLISKCNEQIEEFKKEFVEFNHADWYIDLMLPAGCTPYKTIEMKAK